MARLDSKLTCPADHYAARRRRLAVNLQRPLLILAGRARSRNYPANTYPFRAGSSYLYFGGTPIEGAAWLVEPGSDGRNGCTLFRPPGGFDDTVWMGEPIPDDAIANAAGIPKGAVVDTSIVQSKTGRRPVVAVIPPCLESVQWMASLRISPAGPDELRPIIDLRLRKDEHELAAMRHAAATSVQAHLAGMLATAPGRRESDVAAAMEGVVKQNEHDLSFTPIVTVRGEVLHSSGGANELRTGQLLLADAGTEERGGYASDITRTYPVGGVFNPIQRQIYDIVLRAQRAAIGACVPGRRYRDVHDLAGRVVCEGLVDAGLLRGNVADLAGRFAHTLFFTHGVGHLIGLDVHDMEDFGDLAGYATGRTRRPEFGNKFLRLDRDLEPGMTVTIEPGIYLVPALWQQHELVGPFADVVNRPAIERLLETGFGGIRIEDTVHVRDAGPTGPEVLTAALPTDADVVADIVRRA